MSGRTDPRLGPGREFDRIRGFFEGSWEPTSEIQVGPGDDCAVLRDGIVISTDLALEDVHFRLDWVSPDEAGYRSVAAGLSDLAAMAADPIAVLLSIAVPGDGQGAGELVRGARTLLDERGVPLVGGDLTRSPGPICLDVVSVGRSLTPLLRSGARVGDELWVTGRLGGAAAAVALWRQGRSVPASLRESFAAPQPRIEEARWLLRARARAGIDLSDGLAGDAAHLAAASGVATVLEEDLVPVHPDLDGLELPGPGAGRRLALHGGDDFELLVAVPPGSLAEAAASFRERFSIELTRVGRVEAGTGAHLQSAEGARRPVDTGGGFDHFAAAGEEGGEG